LSIGNSTNPLGYGLDFPPSHKSDREHQLNDIMRAQGAVSVGYLLSL
jgi:hypothetical protein